MGVDRERFNKMSIDQQVQVINNELKNHIDISVTGLLKKKLKLNKSTVISRFTKAGYKYNHEMRRYEKYKSSTKILVDESVENTEVLEEAAVTCEKKYKSNDLVFFLTYLLTLRLGIYM